MGCGGSKDGANGDNVAVGRSGTVHHPTEECQKTAKLSHAELRAQAKESLAEFEECINALDTDPSKMTAFVAVRNKKQLEYLRELYEDGGARVLLDEVHKVIDHEPPPPAKSWAHEIDGPCYKELLLGLLMKEEEYDATCINAAVDRVGTDETVLSEILCLHTPRYIKHVAEEYQKKYGTEMATAIKKDVSGHLKDLYVQLMSGEKKGGSDEEAAAEADTLHQILVTREVFGDDKEKIIALLASYHVHFRHQIYTAYLRKYNETLDAAIENNISAIFGVTDLAFALGIMVKPPQWALAGTLYDAFAGAGKSAHQITRIVVSQRGHHLRKTALYMAECEEYSDGKGFKEMVEADCDGHYKELLLAIAKVENLN